MNLLRDIILTLTGWLFTQNIILVNGFGATISYNYAKQRFKDRVITAVCMSGFVFAAMIFCYLASVILSANESKKYIIPLIYVIIICLMFFITARVLKHYLYNIYIKIKGYLAVAVFNSYIFAVLLINESSKYDFVKSIFFALFSGLAFLVASTIMSFGIKVTNSKYIPKAFRGFPAQMIYIGIICLILTAFNGNIVA